MKITQLLNSYKILLKKKSFFLKSSKKSKNKMISCDKIYKLYFRNR